MSTNRKALRRLYIAREGAAAVEEIRWADLPRVFARYGVSADLWAFARDVGCAESYERWQIAAWLGW